MGYVNASAFAFLKESYERLNVIDVGAARASFMNELWHVFPRESVFSVGIDPINHHTSDKPGGPIVHKTSVDYSVFLQCGVDNVGVITSRTFYMNSDDQTSSFSELLLDNLSSIEDDESKFWYPQDTIDKIKNIENVVDDVAVYPLQEVIDQHLPEGIIHFIKIDAEGKDLEVVKSINDETLKSRVKFITIECPNKVPRFKGESIKMECINYMKSKNFNVFYQMNYEDDPSNRTPMSDVVFVNGEDL
tara:strand:- start:271 stop:1011 length:741 start_codon:yes stop_codon:yes gene_type:complete